MIGLIHSDNIEYMSSIPDKYFDLAIVDPQTGQGEGKKHTSRNNHNITQKNGQTLRVQNNHRVSEWDSAPPEQHYWDQLFRITKHQIILCENYLHFDQKKDSAGRIIWNLLRENDFSACQIMWTDLFQKIEYFEYMWNGMMQGAGINTRIQKGDKSLNEKRIHPSQKPIIMYRWLLKTFAKKGWKIFDSHLGSGSIAIACYEEEFDFVGTEIDIDIDIFNDAMLRYNNHKSQIKLM
jgi:site-specific DNA-methyltransferase (adenine-specific)